MLRVIKRIATLAADDGLIGFQNSLAQDFYDRLGQEYTQNNNDVALVKKLVEAANVGGRLLLTIRVLLPPASVSLVFVLERWKKG